MKPTALALSTGLLFGCATATSQTSETQDEPDIMVELPTALGGGTAMTNLAPSTPPATLHAYGLPLASSSNVAISLPVETEAIALPATVNLSHGVPPVGNQGQTDSCQAWATGYVAMGWWAHHVGLANAEFAPMYLYSQYANGSCSTESYIQTALSLLQQQGIDTQSDYEPMQRILDCATAPDDAERASAANFKISGYTVDDMSHGAKQAIMASLAGGRPVTLGITVYAEFENANASNYVIGAPVAGDTSYGGHAVTAFKYDATGVWILNQWGTGWGNAGWGILSWDFINGSFNNVANVSEADTISGVALTCSDSSSECAAWAQTSQCQENPDYMLTNCCASCVNSKLSYETYEFQTLVDNTSCLDLPDDNSADYSAFQEYTCNGTAAQGFKVVDAGNGIVHLMHLHSGKCVDVQHRGTANGTPIDIYECNGTSAQDFQLQTFNDGSITFVNPGSGRCLDVTQRNAANGTGIQLWDCNGTVAQQWQPIVQ